MKKNITFFLIFLLPVFTYSQRFKPSPYEFIFGIGTSNFLGELGGAKDKVGTHFVKDLDLPVTRQTSTFGVRYKFGDYFALRSSLTYGRLKGDDKLTKEYYRNYRNLNFASNIYELSVNFEAAFMKEQEGKRYRLRGVRGRRGYEMFTYGFVGIGMFHFNPKAKIENTWVALQPLHTEGQGLIKSRPVYHRTAVCIPVGVGIRYTLKRNWSLGLEYGMRYTFTDYIDDVSTTYVDPAVLSAQSNGAIAVELADRSAKPGDEGFVKGITRPGEQRGNPRYNDAYMFATVSLNYKLRGTRRTAPKF